MISVSAQKIGAHSSQIRRRLNAWTCGSSDARSHQIVAMVTFVSVVTNVPQQRSVDATVMDAKEQTLAVMLMTKKYTSMVRHWREA